MPYLLDTNIMSELMRHPAGRIADRIAQNEEHVCTSIIVVAELKYGVVKSGSRRFAGQLAAILGGIEVIPFETPAEVAYAELRTQLERAGRPIGGNDLLIAAHALALDLTLVTANEREFSRVPDLRIENWLR
jgi:tRNA(fMet)-specific endonuclease VapC